MKPNSPFSRRSFLAMAAASPLANTAFAAKSIPVGLELYSVRKELAEDPIATVKAVAAMGYKGVEFYAPYFKWTTAEAKQMRKLIDDLGVVCFSTHNGNAFFKPENIDKAIELNQIMGSKYMVMASAGKVEGLDGWKRIAGMLNTGAEKMQPAGLKAGFHNHATEFKPLEGKLPMEVLAAETGDNVILQLDVGTCVAAGQDPVAWINKNPGRIQSIHLKDWSSAGKGYEVLFGEGDAPWKKIFAAAEKTGGVVQYLIEQEGSHLTPFETAKQCLVTYKKMRA
jgi:sugar phosphate isomerase/epimerase